MGYKYGTKTYSKGLYSRDPGLWQTRVCAPTTWATIACGDEAPAPATALTPQARTALGVPPGMISAYATDPTTPALDLLLPIVADPAGEDLWGDKLNENFLILDQHAQYVDTQIIGLGSAMLTDAPLTGGPYGRMAGAWTQLTTTGAGTAVFWADIQGKPSTFPPSSHGHAQSDITNLTADLGLKAALASPTFTGIPKGPTAVKGTNTTQLATTAFVLANGGSGIGEAPDDGKQYVRKNETWAEFVLGALTATTIPTAPYGTNNTVGPMYAAGQWMAMLRALNLTDFGQSSAISPNTPNIGLGFGHASPYSRLAIRSDDNADGNHYCGIGSTVQIIRHSYWKGHVPTDLCKGLRVFTKLGAGNNATEWAISGEIENYSDGATYGSVAVSGVAFKYGRGNTFGGHFQCNDYHNDANPSDTSATIGVEMNIQAYGLDHPTANEGCGNRVVLDILPYTIGSGGISAPGAEIGMGIRVGGANSTGARFRYGIVISDYVGFTSAGMKNGLRVTTRGEFGVNIEGTHIGGSGLRIGGTGGWGITVDATSNQGSARFTGTAPYGLVLGGAYSGAALLFSTGNTAIAWEATGIIKTIYHIGASVLQFNNAGTERVGLHLHASSPGVRVNGFQVLSSRQTGIADPINEINNLAGTVTLILRAMRNHGLISP